MINIDEDNIVTLTELLRGRQFEANNKVSQENNCNEVKSIGRAMTTGIGCNHGD